VLNFPTSVREFIFYSPWALYSVLPFESQNAYEHYQESISFFLFQFRISLLQKGLNWYDFASTLKALHISTVDDWWYFQVDLSSTGSTCWVLQSLGKVVAYLFRAASLGITKDFGNSFGCDSSFEFIRLVII
jgi:hypothetical protein